MQSSVSIRTCLFSTISTPLPPSGIRSSPDAAQLKLSKINNHVIGVLQKSDPPHCSIMMTTTTTNKTETPFLSSFLSKLLETLGGHSSLPFFLSLLQRRSMTPSLSLSSLSLSSLAQLRPPSKMPPNG